MASFNLDLSSPLNPARSDLYQILHLQSSISSSSMPLPSLSPNLQPPFNPLKPNSEHERAKIDRWIGSASAAIVSNRCNLDMCTETLGLENGAMCLDYEFEIDAGRKKRMTEKQRSYATMEFPPPLTTLRGEGRLILRRKSEKGRVLLIGFRPWVLEAERSGGRLVLRIPARGLLKEREEEKEEMVVSYGCGGKIRNVAAMFSSEAFLLAT